MIITYEVSEIEKLIDISQPVYIFCKVIEHIICSLREIPKVRRTEEVYECESCEGFPNKNKYCLY